MTILIGGPRLPAESVVLNGIPEVKRTQEILILLISTVLASDIHS